jgi:transposase
VRQSGSEPTRHGRISKQGPGETRHVLVEAAWHVARTTGPLRVFHERIAVRRGRNIATVAVARKLAVIAWHMLSRGEDYAFARPSLTREKIRKLELLTGAERRKGKRNPVRVFATREQHQLDKQLAAHAELALPPTRPGLAARHQGHRCRTGARIFRSAEATSSAAERKAPFTAALVSDIGRFNDKSFNQLQYEGLKRAQKRQ